MNAYVSAVKKLCRGEATSYDDCPAEVQLLWSQYELTVWYAAYGPKALAAAGENGDGLVLQIADPGLCKWFTEQALAAGEKAGRDMSAYKIMAAAPAWTGSMEACIEQTRWFPAMVGNHVADIVEKYGKDSTSCRKASPLISSGAKATTIGSTPRKTPSISTSSPMMSSRASAF